VKLFVNEEGIEFFLEDFELNENVKLVKFIKKFMERYNKFPSPKETRLKLSNDELIEHLKMVLQIDTSEYTQEVILGEIEDFIRQKCIMDVVFKIAETVSNVDTEAVNSSTDEMREALSFYLSKGS
jgi:hypothetical protein